MCSYRIGNLLEGRFIQLRDHGSSPKLRTLVAGTAIPPLPARRFNRIFQAPELRISDLLDSFAIQSHPRFVSERSLRPNPV
jgi:hypothetical protein